MTLKEAKAIVKEKYPRSGCWNDWLLDEHMIHDDVGNVIARTTGEKTARVAWIKAAMMLAKSEEAARE